MLEAWKQLKRPKQEDIKFQASMGYTARPYLKIKRAGNLVLWQSAYPAATKLQVPLGIRGSKTFPSRGSGRKEPTFPKHPCLHQL